VIETDEERIREIVRDEMRIAREKENAESTRRAIARVESIFGPGSFPLWKNRPEAVDFHKPAEFAPSDTDRDIASE
jgi:hypothetical protein